MIGAITKLRRGRRLTKFVRDRALTPPLLSYNISLW